MQMPCAGETQGQGKVRVGVLHTKGERCAVGFGHPSAATCAKTQKLVQLQCSWSESISVTNILEKLG